MKNQHPEISKINKLKFSNPHDTSAKGAYEFWKSYKSGTKTATVSYRMRFLWDFLIAIYDF